MNEARKKFNPDFRPYKFKTAHEQFFCPLCKTERAFSLGHKLSLKNYGQIIIVTLFTSLFLYPFMGFESLYSFFAIWTAFEISFRANFRKEIPCPHCGFDASWYRKDIKIARKLVDEFWQVKAQEESEEVEKALPQTSEIPDADNVDGQAYF
ncbi:MAG: hypothetical protein HN576_00500 [Bacteriovoracaceae bacterium]|jgi:hypothetical protein|nr:hypothetical protein [Bacteriovoracaceae bacterium]